MRFIVYLGHPAHFHLFRNMISILKDQGHAVLIIIKKKDVLEELVQSTGWDYINVLPKGRADNKLAIAWALFKRDLQFLSICKKFRPDLMMGTSAEITHAGRLMGITSVVVNEDDAKVVPFFAKLAYPFADLIVAPDCCDTGKWSYKKRGYQGYHELAYLRPEYFTPDEKTGAALKGKAKRYFILRFAKLTAHHDEGRTGINANVAARLIEILEPHGNVYISAERRLETQFEKYRIRIAPQDMLSAMFYADIYIGDSQTMAAEAAVLGTPSVRYNDFVGEISYLEELEHKYGLTYGIRANDPAKLYNTVLELVNNNKLKEQWQARKTIMLEKTIDVTKLLADIARNFRRKKGSGN